MLGRSTANRVRAALVLAPVLALVHACSVPDVEVVQSPLTSDDASAESSSGASPDAAAASDGATQDDATQPGADASHPGADAGDPADADEGSAPDGAGPYCTSNNPPPNARCCASGAVYYGNCNKNACSDCGNCAWPMFCCCQGATGQCQSTPCKHADAGEPDAALDGAADAPVDATGGGGDRELGDGPGEAADAAREAAMDAAAD